MDQPSSSFDPYASPAEPTRAADALSNVTSDEKLWAMLAHLAGFLGYAATLGQYVGPLVIYIVYKDKSKFVAFHALQSLYFQLASLVLIVALIVIGFFTCGIGWLLIAPLGVGIAVYCVIAAIKANQGELFEYWIVGKWAREQVGI